MSLRIACTGGIGSGKSTVARLLADRGAAVVDADAVARQVVEPGAPALGEIVRRFGEAIVRRDGSLDRAALAAVVFADPLARGDLESIVHPRVHEVLARLLPELAATHPVVVLELPLLVDAAARRLHHLDGVLAVDCPEDLALERLVSRRGLAESDARARLAAQPARAERIANADFVILNVGSFEELAEMVGRAWSWIASLGELALSPSSPTR